MGSLIDSLPGVRLPVSKVMDTLSRMWDAPVDAGSRPVSDFRASQLNLILHFGIATTNEEASARFGEAIRFAQRYPCRIIVLCPEGGRPADGEEVEGKLFSQCYIGSDSVRSMCCCEALMLGYPTSDSSFLENMVSVWLENDLPTYHWFSRVPADRIAGNYLSFIKKCTRVLFDSSIEPDGFLKDVPWPQPAAVRDLAEARMLPVRQNVGQFLSAYEPTSLVDGLQSVRILCPEGRIGEGRHLLQWQLQALASCRGDDAGEADVDASCAAAEADEIRIEWTYADSKRYFRWSYSLSNATATVEASLGKGKVGYPTPLRLLQPEQTLAEAMFFG